VAAMGRCGGEEGAVGARWEAIATLLARP